MKSIDFSNNQISELSALNMACKLLKGPVETKSRIKFHYFKSQNRQATSTGINDNLRFFPRESQYQEKTILKIKNLRNIPRILNPGGYLGILEPMSQSWLREFQDFFHLRVPTGTSQVIKIRDIEPKLKKKMISKTPMPHGPCGLNFQILKTQ